MDKRLIITIVLNLFFLNFSNAQFHLSEKKLSKNKISKQIINYVEKNYKNSAVKYYKLKTHKDSIFYEAKVKSKQGKINLIFGENGQFIRMDNEVDYVDISKEIRAVINKHLSEKFSSYKVTHCRDERNEGQKIYVLDVKAKKKKYKFRFKNDGSLIDYKIIPQKTLDFIFN